ncbi:putative manganese transporter [Reinekea marinisedimentorum]|uniref:Putative 10TM heavy-metal exporter n=1 Tax=Reinekea marinisedimentorum TaxID=230495 RepID=A0A4R3IEC6_9GAMM|nr:putative manganese transporter [Reinekea marinisedimentorum]TCS43948.1 putative 10TM heavy-metal exporter [Reinekea marinisedimentorum]
MQLINAIQSERAAGFKSQFRVQNKRLVLPVAMFALLIAEPTREVVVNTLADAFWAVSAYVAFTLAIYHLISKVISSDNKVVQLFNSSRNYQVFFSALLGALPGCGGAIIVATQFVSGRVGFGALVAVLTSTMGDAAFLLLAAKPEIGLALVAMGVVVGAVSGWIVNAMHADSFLRPEQKDAVKQPACAVEVSREQKGSNLQGQFWAVLLIPVAVIAGLGSFQIDANAFFGLPEISIEWAGAALLIVSMVLWAITKEVGSYEDVVSEDTKFKSAGPMQKTAQDTNFVTAWVVVAFLVFELSTAFSGVDLAAAFSGWGVWMPLIGLAVGMLPGCGPQILVSSLYLAGAVPLSTQISNSISNDGDALFPAIALAPKAALVATFYSAVPALVVGYGYFLLFEV